MPLAGAVHHITVIKIPIGAAVKALGSPLTVCAIAHFCAVAVLDYGQRPVLAVMGKASGAKADLGHPRRTV